MRRNSTITVTVRPRRCSECGAALRRIRRKAWRKGYIQCTADTRHDWYGKGEKKDVIKARRLE